MSLTYGISFAGSLLSTIQCQEKAHERTTVKGPADKVLGRGLSFSDGSGLFSISHLVVLPHCVHEGISMCSLQLCR